MTFEPQDEREPNNGPALFAFFFIALLLGALAIAGFAFVQMKRAKPTPSCPGGVCPPSYPGEYSGEYAAAAAAERPTVNLPYSLRQTNWVDPATRSGSCWHASLKSVFNWQGQTHLKNWWPYQGGEYADRGHKRLDSAGVKYAATTSGNVRLLEWMLRTRRGAVITYWPAHAVTLVHLDDQWAGILDNNRTNQVIWVPRREFIPKWQGYGGWATSPVYSPAPPIPHR